MIELPSSMIAGYLSGLMSASTLLLQTESGTHELACTVGDVLEIGSAPDGAVQIDGEGILPRHLTLKRVAEDRFQITCLSREVPALVNGVCASELEVAVPFQLSLAGGEFGFSLPEEAAAASSARRRDYLITPSARLRAAPSGERPSYPPPVEKRAATRPSPLPASPVSEEVDGVSTGMVLLGILAAVGMGLLVWFWIPSCRQRPICGSPRPPCPSPSSWKSPPCPWWTNPPPL
jgi:hypothetical protein